MDSRICVRGIRLHPTGVLSNVLQRRNMEIFCRDVYGERLYLPTRFEPGITRNTDVIADRTI